LLSSAIGWSALYHKEDGVFSIDSVYRDLDQQVARRIEELDADDCVDVYGYEDGSAETFQTCRNRGGMCFYDLPIGYWRAWHRIRDEEIQREPEWAVTLQGVNESSEKLERKEAEIAMANHVFVASTFTKQTLRSAPNGDANAHVLTYGAPSVYCDTPAPYATKRLRVLFVGALSQRKGLSYLLEAVTRLGAFVELTLVGRPVSKRCIPLEHALRKHRWIPSIPHGEVLAEMRKHDVLVFPSLFEGFGLVILEAMSQGVPVITTPHTAGPDVIKSGDNGYIVPIRSSAAIAGCLEALLNDRALLNEMKHNARTSASQSTWEHYRSRLAALTHEARNRVHPGSNG
jgi:glycosyltransferase involved in cell wall biosynthesis